LINTPGAWLDKAREDILMAELALGAKLFSQVCFHSQQAVEKALKGYLLKTTGEYPHEHSLLALYEGCRGEDGPFAKFRDDLLFLDQFYTPARYPDAAEGFWTEGEPEKRDAQRSLDVAKKIVDAVTQKVQGTHN